MGNLEQQLRSIFGEIKRTNSTEYMVNCPKCLYRVGKVDTKFHLYIQPVKYNPTLRKRGAWHCHRCLWKGWGLEALGIKPIEETSKLIELRSYRDKFKLAPLTETVEFPEYFSNEFSNSKLGMECFNYLTKTRGLRPDQVFYYKIGFCSDGKYKNCVILPVFEDGKLVYFVGRNIYQKRYTNAPIPNRGVLFNYTQQDEVILTEGIFDAISVGYNGVALLGKFLKDDQKKLLIKGLPKITYVMLDEDAKEAAVTIAKTLSTVLPNVRLLSTFNKKDPGLMTEEEVKYSLENWYPVTLQGVIRYLDGTKEQTHTTSQP